MKSFKKVISLLLTAVLLLSCCSAFASAQSDYDHNPQIYIYGLGSANIYFEDDPEKKPLLWPMNMDRILGNFKNADKSIAQAIREGNPDILYTVLYNFFEDSFGMLAMGKDGSTPVEGVVVEPTTIVCDDDGRYEFFYDSRLSPIEIAPQLDTYIDMVLEHSGKEKVEITSTSYGVIVLNAYLELYAHKLDRIDSVAYGVSPVNGLNYFAELINGEVNVNPYDFRDFLSGRLGSDGLGVFLDIMNAAGVLQPMLDALIIPTLKDAIFDALLDYARKDLITVPAFWTVIPPSYMERTLITCFGENYQADDHEYAVLIDKILAYNEIAKKSYETIENTIENNPGLHFALIVKYGISPIPLGSEPAYADDGFVKVKDASYGATSGLHGKPLDKDYTQQLYTEFNFMSPDRCIDASTGILPFTTWYVKGLEHSIFNEGYWEMLNTIVYEDLDVFTSEKFPQYLQVDPEDEQAIIHCVEPEDDRSFIERLLYFFLDFFVGIRDRLYEFIKGRL